jgi:hypothetical protein
MIMILPYIISVLLSDTSIPSTSQIRAPTMLLLLSVGNRRFAFLQQHNFRTKFRADQASGFKT